MQRHHRIKKVLIANRGEIALRIQRCCTKLGIDCVQAISAVDRDTLFAREAAEVVELGPAAPSASYLNIKKIVQVAKESGCDAVHPGYGFLSENAHFAQAVIDAGLTFIGPTPAAIEIMGSKTSARERVTKFKVPCTPGTKGGLSDRELIYEAKRIGFPVLIKAEAGGGGRGMRIANSAYELRSHLPLARGEAKKNFGNESVYLERYFERPRHIEVQVFGDAYGNVVHLGTRDCSTQRRHQKLIEEAPAPLLPPKIRQGIQKAAIAAAKSVGYQGAGTVEFLVEGARFYFLEMNTRIQVEHPVTEAITGIDLVELQFLVAAGEALPFSQKEIEFSGHAFEFRICAEDPERGFAPATGRLARIERPNLPFPREDFGFEAGDLISPFYDSMLGKLIIWGVNRADALERSRTVLSSYVILGVPTTLDFALWMTENGLFRRGGIDIGFVGREFTSSSIRDLRARRVRDPAYIEPIGGAEMKNCYEYTSQKFNTKYTIEVLHRKDGFFMAVPVDAKGRRAPNKHCRMSNGLDTVMRSLIDDVLEKNSPSELFQQ